MARAPHTHLVSTASPRRVSHAQLGLTEVNSTTADPSLGFYLHKRPAGGHCSLHPSGLRCSAQKGSRPARSSRARKAKLTAADAAPASPSKPPERAAWAHPSHRSATQSSWRQ